MAGTIPRLLRLPPAILSTLLMILAVVINFSVTLANPSTSASTSSKINKDLEKETMFVYPPGVLNESSVPFCPTLTTPCNYIQNPFFFPFKILRLCKCPNQLVCPYDYEVKRKFDTVFLNNREQIKFCSELPKCGTTEDSILEIGDNGYPVELNCFCPKRRYWTRMETNSDRVQYKCEKVKPCHEADCGTVREDTYASFFRCSCPAKQLCMPYKRTPEVDEVTYSGAGHVSRCEVP